MATPKINPLESQDLTNVTLIDAHRSESSRSFTRASLASLAESSMFGAYIDLARPVHLIHRPSRVRADSSEAYFTDEVLQVLAKSIRPGEMSKPFIEQCIGEVVTLASPVDFDFPVGEEMYNITLSRRRLAGQRIRVFQYMTMTTSNKKLDAGPKRTYRTVGNEVREAFGFDYRDSEGRTGAWMGYAMLLPEKQATKLWSYLLRRPIAIRELTELVMTQPGAKSDVTGQPISPEVWAARRPPYEGMRRAAQGAAYIAFRTESAQSVEKSEVLAF